MSITLGAEEELQIVSQETLGLTPHDHALAALEFPDTEEKTSIEMHQCTLEIKTGICRSPDEVVLELQQYRQFAAQRAAAQSQYILSAGLHPEEDWRDQPVHEGMEKYPHYTRLLREYGDLARGIMSFGLHVHLGLPDPGLRIPVMNRIREFLPVVLALSANAPFCQGRDTGLHSWRHSLLGRLPRMGIPEIWQSEKDYLAYVKTLQDTECISPTAALWEDLRLHHVYQTLEVRICDAHHSLDRIWLLVALLQVEAAVLCDELVQGAAKPAIARMKLEENKWRARRYGLHATLIDWHTARPLTVAEFLGRWLDRVKPKAQEMGLWARLELGIQQAFREGSGADEQRRWMHKNGQWQDVVRELVKRTSIPWQGA